MNYDKRIHLGNHHGHNEDTEHFHHPQPFAVNPWWSTPWPQENTDLLLL